MAQGVTAVMKTGGDPVEDLFQGAELTFCSDEDEEDETAELLRELEKIKKERAEQREREVFECQVPLCHGFR